jgi:F-type H+-transporting ATPase subunit a
VAHKEEKKRVWGRWVVLAAILLGVFLFYILGIKPIRPEVFLPGEKLMEEPLFGIEGLYLTNTLIGLIAADLIVFLLAFFINRAVKRGALVLTGVTGVIEFLMEYLYNITEGTAGKWTKQIFPWFATITLLVLCANWLGILPGVETIGLIHEGHGEYAVRDLGSIGGLHIQTICDDPFLCGEPAAESHAEEAAATEAHAEEGEHHGAAVVPFFRPVSTDLNFTTALALVAVIMVQVMGFRAQGVAYLWKFWNTGTLFNKPIFGFIDFAVGLLELISEFSKVLSFAFRLFGNMFAGAVLLFVIGTLVPVFAQSIFYLLEFFVGLIQAIVFGMLTMVFMSQATQGHGGEHHEEAHA